MQKIDYCATHLPSTRGTTFLQTDPDFFLKAKSSSTGEESMSDSDDDENGDDDMEAETADVWEDIGDLKETRSMVRTRSLRKNPSV